MIFFATDPDPDILLKLATTGQICIFKNPNKVF
jgi:hypothetical protein